MLDKNRRESVRWKDPINITKEQWMSLLRDEEITTEKDMQLLQLIYDSDDGMARASQLAQLLNMSHHAPLNSQVGRWGKRIVKKLNIQPIPKKQGEGYNWWHVPFWGDGTEGEFYWILRPELEDAMRELTERNFPEEIDLHSYENLYEGAKKQIYVNSYERNSTARNLCIKCYGTRCSVCGFDFEKTYGAVGSNVIHVHHLKPLSEIGEIYRVDPKEDLRPVCPNCHLIIHKKDPPYSIDEVIAMMKETDIE